MATYERECWWCEPSKYVKATRISAVSPAPNSDKLDVIEFDGIDYKTVGARGLYKPGQAVIFIPGESLLPKEFSDAIGVTQYLSSGRVKTIKLRGNRSEGLICTPEQYRPFADKILKWEDRPYIAGKPRSPGKRFRDYLCPSKVPTGFVRFYDQPNLKNAPHTFASGERVVYSEKLHGCSTRFAVLPCEWKWWARPIAWLLGDILGLDGWQTDRVIVGSHNVVLDVSANGMWQAAFRKFLTVTKDEKVAPRIPKGIVFFGETFGVFNGSKIQHLTYGRDDLDMKLFAAYDPAKNEYLLPAEFEALCDEYGLPRVQFHRAIFTTVADFDKIANTPSEVTDKHHREGIVLCSEERRCVFGKVISFEYLENNSRTEGH
jgi:hypothetical protein